MNNRLFRTFEHDFIRFSDEYFENETNKQRIKENQTSKEELIEIALQDAITNIEASIQRVSKDEGLYEDFPRAIDLQITTVYCPNEKYLAKVVELFDVLTMPKNEKYLNYVMFFDPSLFWNNPRSHSNIVSLLITDSKYFDFQSPHYGNNKIISYNNRFTGILSYLFVNGYRNLYEKMIQDAFIIAKNYSFLVGKLIVSLYHFLKEYDGANFKIFADIVDNLKKEEKLFLISDTISNYLEYCSNSSDKEKIIEILKNAEDSKESIFATPGLIGKYINCFGIGFDYKKEYYGKSLLDLFE